MNTWERAHTQATSSAYVARIHETLRKRLQERQKSSVIPKVRAPPTSTKWVIPNQYEMPSGDESDEEGSETEHTATDRDCGLDDE